MNLNREKEYIKNFIDSMTDEEFTNVMKKCGNETILPTDEIFRAFEDAGFYNIAPKYKVQTGFVVSEKINKYDEYYLSSSNGQGVAA